MRAKPVPSRCSRRVRAGTRSKSMASRSTARSWRRRRSPGRRSVLSVVGRDMGSPFGCGVSSEYGHRRTTPLSWAGCYGRRPLRRMRGGHWRTTGAHYLRDEVGQPPLETPKPTDAKQRAPGHWLCAPPALAGAPGSSSAPSQPLRECAFIPTAPGRLEHLEAQIALAALAELRGRTTRPEGFWLSEPAVTSRLVRSWGGAMAARVVPVWSQRHTGAANPHGC